MLKGGGGTHADVDGGAVVCAHALGKRPRRHVAWGCRERAVLAVVARGGAHREEERVESIAGADESEKGKEGSDYIVVV